MPGYEPKRPRPTPQSADSEAQVDALLDGSPPNEATQPPSSNPFADTASGVAAPESSSSESGSTESSSPESISPESTVIAEPSPADPATEPRKRVQSLPPEPDGHGPGPVVPMTVAAVLGFLMLLYVLRRRRRRHG